MSIEKYHAPETRHTVDVSNLDTAAAVVAGTGDIELDATEAKRIRAKIDWHLMPLMCSKFWVPVPNAMLKIDQLFTGYSSWTRPRSETPLCWGSGSLRI
jgi:hypothetical protein